MATETINLKLLKPDVNDFYDIADSNGNMDIIDSKIKEQMDTVTAHKADKTNPHAVTKTQVGLPNVDNTADLQKPLSAAMQTALSGKAPTVHTHIKAEVGLQNADNTADNLKVVLAASKLQTGRTINGVPFDGTANITVSDSSKELAFSKNTAFNKNFGSGAGTVTEGNDGRLSNARPASDVFAWAKASTKPSYNKAEVGLGNVDNTADNVKTVAVAGTCSGNAATASRLQTARTINGVNFDGTAGINISAPANGGTASSCSGNAATASRLQTARTINGVNFDGTAGINISAPANGGTASYASYLQTARNINGVAFNGGSDITVYDGTKAPLSNPVFPANVTVNGNMTLKGSGNFGNKINFGDGDYCTISEPADDTLQIKGSRVKIFNGGTEVINVEGNKAFYLGNELGGGGSVFDKVIRTQAEFDSLISSSNWLGATSVCFVGNGGGFKFTKSIDANRIGVQIPGTVKYIQGINNPIIEVTSSSIATSSTIFAVQYMSPVAADRYYCDGIDFRCIRQTHSNYSDGTFYALYGFKSISHCTLTLDITINSSESSSSGIYSYIHGWAECKSISDCQSTINVTATRSNNYGVLGTTVYGFYSAENVVNTKSILNVAYSNPNFRTAATAQGFVSCKKMCNCIATVTCQANGDTSSSDNRVNCTASGFQSCYDVTNCVSNAKAICTNYCNISAAGFANIDRIVNCHGIGEGVYSGTSSGYMTTVVTGFYGCRGIANCSCSGIMSSYPQYGDTHVTPIYNGGYVNSCYSDTNYGQSTCSGSCSYIDKTTITNV